MVEEALNRENIRDYFVFLSVNWEAKGQRIKKLIEDMQLRPDNVLFLDDNHLNLEEAKYYCPKIMTAGPEAIADLCHKADACKKQDLKHTRWNRRPRIKLISPPMRNSFTAAILRYALIMTV